MVEIVLGIIISVIIVVLSTYLVRLFDIVLDIYSDEKRNQCFQIKFSQFKKFYSISPEKYKLFNLFVVKEGNPAHYIKFNIIDTFRYIHFTKQLEKNKDSEHMDTQMRAYLNSVQDDIIELNKKAQEEIEKANKELDL